MRKETALVGMAASLMAASCAIDSRHPGSSASPMPVAETGASTPETLAPSPQADRVPSEPSGPSGPPGPSGPSEPPEPSSAAVAATLPNGPDAGPQTEESPAPSCTDVCSDVCVDLSTDPNHCGRCGHGCLNAACIAGVCEPATLVVGNYGDVALSPGRLYVVDQTLGTSLSSLTTEGGPRFPFSGALDNPPYALFADDAFVYAALFLRPGVSEVWRMPLSGGGPSSEEGGVLLGQVGSTVGLGSTETSLVSLEGRPTERSLERRITRFDKATGGSATLVATVNPVVSDAFATDENNAYVFEGVEADVQILSVPLDGTPPRSLAFQRPGESFTALAAAGGNIVFATTARIGRVGSEGLPETMTEGGAYHVLADPDFAYYFTGDDTCTRGTDVYAVSFSGGDPSHLAHEPSVGCIEHVVADDDAIYFLTADGSELRKMTKR